jgi:hypothetical protein
MSERINEIILEVSNWLTVSWRPSWKPSSDVTNQATPVVYENRSFITVYQKPATYPKLSHSSSFIFISIIPPSTPSSAQDVSSLQFF